MLESDDFTLLLYLGKRSNLNNPIVSSTSEIALDLGTSQQTVSRKLRGLEQKDLIQRSASPVGTKIFITEKGKNALRQKFNELRNLFGKRAEKKLQGIVVIGLGEGSYYLSQPNYAEKLKEKLGYGIFIGTLNLKVKEKELQNFLEGENYFLIEGFSTKERSFGALSGLKIKIDNAVDGALILPERSNIPKNIIEIVAPINLRKKFNLKDGSKVTISLSD